MKEENDFKRWLIENKLVELRDLINGGLQLGLAVAVAIAGGFYAIEVSSFTDRMKIFLTFGLATIGVVVLFLNYLSMLVEFKRLFDLRAGRGMVQKWRAALASLVVSFFIFWICVSAVIFSMHQVKVSCCCVTRKG